MRSLNRRAHAFGCTGLLLTGLLLLSNEARAEDQRTAPAEPAANQEHETDKKVIGEGLLAVGGGYSRWFSNHGGAFAIGGGYGMRIGSFGLRGELLYERGLAGGLRTQRITPSVQLEAILGAIRIGGGFGLAHSSFARATKSDSVGSFVLVPNTALSVDVVRSRSVDVFLGARGTLEVGSSASRLFVNPGLQALLGFRFH